MFVTLESPLPKNCILHHSLFHLQILGHYVLFRYFQQYNYIDILIFDRTLRSDNFFVFQTLFNFFHINPFLLLSKHSSLPWINKYGCSMMKCCEAIDNWIWWMRWLYICGLIFTGCKLVDKPECFLTTCVTGYIHNLYSVYFYIKIFRKLV